jgi:hypothetical protein
MLSNYLFFISNINDEEEPVLNNVKDTPPATVIGNYNRQTTTEED